MASFLVRLIEADPPASLIEAGVHRRKIAAELNISEYEARKLIATSRNGAQ